MVIHGDEDKACSFSAGQTMNEKIPNSELHHMKLKNN